MSDFLDEINYPCLLNFTWTGGNTISEHYRGVQNWSEIDAFKSQLKNMEEFIFHFIILFLSVNFLDLRKIPNLSYLY